EERRRGEMQVLARLNHPSLVRLYDAGTDAQDDGTHHWPTSSWSLSTARTSGSGSPLAPHARRRRAEERRRGEMQVLARLNHPSLVRLYDAGTDAQDDG
ncbi:hypothetical protein CTI14_61185, partial [Methylobacterium radiotolerans]